MKFFWAIMLIFFISRNSHIIHGKDNNRIVCYLGSWATYRQGDGKYEVEDIDPGLCTHVIYAFAGIDSQTFELISLDPYLDLPGKYRKDGYGRVVKLKEKNANLKVLLSVGGRNEPSEKYSKMARYPKTRGVFISSAVSMLQAFGFDGLDLDWEYPAQRGGIRKDKTNLILLLEELQRELHKNGMILSIAVGMEKHTIEVSYDIPSIAKNVDFVNMMTYDFRGSWDGFTGHHTQMYASPFDSLDYVYHNLNSSVNLWIESGVAKEKLNVGTAFYGQTYTVPKYNGFLIVPSSGPGIPGIYSKGAGSLSYNEICLLLEDKTWMTTTDDYVRAPWSSKDDQFIAYDDEKSVFEKNQWAKNLGLGGSMIWSVDRDDFRGKCRSGNYPLLKIINDVWKEETTQSPIISTILPTNIWTEISTNIPQSTNSTHYTTTSVITTTYSTIKPTDTTVTTYPFTTEPTSSFPDLTTNCSTSIDSTVTTSYFTTESTSTFHNLTTSFTTSTKSTVKTSPFTTEATSTFPNITSFITSTDSTVTTYPSTTEPTSAFSNMTTSYITSTDTTIAASPFTTEATTTFPNITTSSITSTDSTVTTSSFTTELTSALPNMTTSSITSTDTTATISPFTTESTSTFHNITTSFITSTDRTVTTYPFTTELTSALPNMTTIYITSTDTTETAYPFTSEVTTTFPNITTSSITTTDSTVTASPFTTELTSALPNMTKSSITSTDTTVTIFPFTTEATSTFPNITTNFITSTDSTITTYHPFTTELTSALPNMTTSSIRSTDTTFTASPFTTEATSDSPYIATTMSTESTVTTSTYSPNPYDDLTTISTSTTTHATVTCIYGDYKRDTSDCSRYYICSYVTTAELEWILLTCGNLFFDPTTLSCVPKCPWDSMQHKKYALNYFGF